MLHILVVGKTPSFLDFTHRFFEGMDDLTVDQVPSADEAVGRMAGVHYDTVIAEHHPPKTDGIGFLERLQSSGNATALVLYAGRATRADFIRAANHGVAYILQKDGDLSSQKEAFLRILRPAGTARSAAPADIQSFARIAPVGIFRTDLQGNCTYVNERWCDIAGLTAEEALGDGCIRAIHPEDRDRVSREWDNAAREQRLFRQEYRFLRPDGRVTWVVGQAGAEVDPSGRSTGYVGTIADITDRRTAEERVAHLASFPELNPNPVLELDPSGKVLYSNPALIESLSSLGREVDPRVFLPGDFPAILQGHDEGKGRAVEREVRVADRVFLESISVNPRIGTVRIYARDITDRKRAEEALRISEQKFAKAFRASPDVLVISRQKDGLIIDANDHWERVFGYPRAEVIGQSSLVLGLFVNPAQRQQVVALLREQGSVHEFPVDIRTRSGDVRQTTLSVEQIELDKEPCMLTVLHDITERTRAEEALRNREAMLNEMGHIARIGGWEHDLGTGTATWTKALYEIDELESGPPPGTGEHLDQYLPRDRAILEAAYRRAVETGEPFDLELQVYTAKKHLIWGRVIGRPVMVKGRCVRMAGTFQDITDRKRAENAAREKAEELDTFFAAVQDLLTITNTEGYFLRFNDAWERILGYPPVELQGHRFLDFVHPEDREATLAAMADLNAQQPIPSFVNRYRARDGQYRWIEWKLVPHGSLIFASARDITDRRGAEIEREKLFRDLEQKNTELERFTYTVSHDLKSPLITIVGFLGFLEEEARKGDFDRLNADIKRIKAATEKMQTLLSDLLNLSKIGRIVNPPVQVPFATIAREAVEQLQGPLQQRGVTIEIAPDLPVVSVDHERLREVVVNLVENAVKFMGEQPTPKIEIGVRSGQEGPVFYVRDNGIGIDPQYQGKIFGLFEKLDARADGTGVGLAVVRRIIEVHGCRIWVESAGKNTGSTFWFTLPVVQEEGTMRNTQREG